MYYCQLHYLKSKIGIPLLQAVAVVQAFVVLSACWGVDSFLESVAFPFVVGSVGQFQAGLSPADP